MKIAYIYDGIYPYIGGGAEKRFWELATRLARRGHEVHIYGRDPGIGESSFIKEGVHIHAVSKHMDMYSPGGVRSIRQVIYFSWGINFALWREKFDIIDTNAFPYLHFYFIKLYCFFKKVPLVVTWQEVWGKYWYVYLGRCKGWAGYFIERLVISGAGNIIVHSGSVKNKLQSLYGKKNLQLIPNGIDLACIDAVAAADEEIDLIFVGRLIRDKNIDLLLKSVALLKDEGLSLRCVIIGSGPEKEELQRLAAESDLGQQVVFKEALEYKKLISLMKAAKIFVFPSTREGFGIVVIEAMACGLPAILAAHPMNAATELVKEGLTGYICEANEKAFSDKIKVLINDRQLRSLMAVEARKRVAQYDWDNVAVQNENFYFQVIRHF